MTSKYNFRAICDLTENVLNLEKGQLKDKSRKRPLQIARQVAAIIARKEEDIHQKIIGLILNRDRSLIYYYEHKHEGNYKYCSLYRDAYNKVYKAYKDIESSKDVFIKGSHIKNYLLKKGIKEAPLNLDDVVIAVYSGEASTLIKVTYLDFANQLENIKLALKNYHYKIEIM
tara:strand:+ start:281 stop:796 length:516 start_codon:yes stop_codon:yes gene_type:complete